VILVVIGALAALLGLQIVGTRPAHRPSDVTLRRVPLSVSCPSSRFCMAVDDEGNAIAFDGQSWSKPSPLHVLGMTTVSCASADFCVAGAINNSVLVLRSGTWSKPMKLDVAHGGLQDNFGNSGVTTVSCPDPSFCMAGNVRGTLATFDGSGWTPATRLEPQIWYEVSAYIGATAIERISCTSATFCVAVTVSGHVYTWSGRSWTGPARLASAADLDLANLTGLPPISSLSCASSTFCVAVRSSGNINYYDGKSWSKPVSIDDTSSQTGNRDGLTSVSCQSVRFCVAVDDLGRALTYDGSAWSAPRTVDPALGLSTVSCPNKQFCVALNDLGAAFVYDGASWSPPRILEK
jgi:hypothetical protein